MYYLVICEGPSEEAYLKKLNIALRENFIDINFTPFVVGCGHFNSVRNYYKQQKSNNPRSEYIIWMDYDIYKRNEKDNLKKYNNKSKGMPDFLFNYHNFEDILAMHLSDKQLKKWIEICRKHNHFNRPMVSAEYVPLFCQNIIADYDKGGFPWEEFDLKALVKAFKNNKDESIPFHSYFLDELEKILMPELKTKNIIP